jgi:hypothetical protein
LQGNIGWKIVSCDSTFAIPQPILQQPAILNIIALRSLKNAHIISTAIVRKKTRDLKEVAN